MNINDETVYRIKGVEDPGLDDLESGMKVIIKGTLQPDGTLLAKGVGAAEAGPREGRLRGEIIAIEGDTFTVRAGRREHLTAEILEGHTSTAVCHTGNISYRLGQKESVKKMRAQVRDIPAFNNMFERLLKHLAVHDIDADAGTVTLGPWLDIDRENERFISNERANRLVRGFYRAPYIVPDLSA